MLLRVSNLVNNYIQAIPKARTKCINPRHQYGEMHIVASVTFVRMYDKVPQCRKKLANVQTMSILVQKKKLAVSETSKSLHNHCNTYTGIVLPQCDMKQMAVKNNLKITLKSLIYNMRGDRKVTRI